MVHIHLQPPALHHISQRVLHLDGLVSKLVTREKVVPRGNHAIAAGFDNHVAVIKADVPEPGVHRVRRVRGVKTMVQTVGGRRIALL